MLINRARNPDTQIIAATHSSLLLDDLPGSSLFVCRKEEGSTAITPFGPWGEHDLLRQQAIDTSLDEEDLATPVSERIRRGDFDD